MPEKAIEQIAPEVLEAKLRELVAEKISPEEKAKRAFELAVITINTNTATDLFYSFVKKNNLGEILGKALGFGASDYGHMLYKIGAERKNLNIPNIVDKAQTKYPQWAQDLIRRECETAVTKGRPVDANAIATKISGRIRAGEKMQKISASGIAHHIARNMERDQRYPKAVVSTAVKKARGPSMEKFGRRVDAYARSKGIFRGAINPWARNTSGKKTGMGPNALRKRKLL